MHKKREKKPWPTKEAMAQIYKDKLWGAKEGVDFYSGRGSHSAEILHPYIKEVIRFLNSFSKKLVVCDLGCGDFNVGQHLIAHTEKYVAIDIVPDLIDRNRDLFKQDILEFHCLDISKDTLPKADCVIVRQVLQHLSNAEISNILEKLKAYAYVILTEHVPMGEFVANKDIISGQGIRIKKKSGVDILKSPFGFPGKLVKVLVTSFYDDKSNIVTSLYQTYE